MQYTHEMVNARSIQLKWNNTYPECFNFTVVVAGMVNETTDNSNYTISDLSYSTTYNVCVFALNGHGKTRTNWTHCENITTGMFCQVLYLWPIATDNATVNRFALS